jgi:hypothetical protein
MEDGEEEDLPQQISSRTRLNGELADHVSRKAIYIKTVQTTPRMQVLEH